MLLSGSREFFFCDLISDNFCDLPSHTFKTTQHRYLMLTLLPSLTDKLIQPYNLLYGHGTQCEKYVKLQNIESNLLRR